MNLRRIPLPHSVYPEVMDRMIKALAEERLDWTVLGDGSVQVKMDDRVRRGRSLPQAMGPWLNKFTS